MRDRIGLYVHIPFCVSKCPYCDFYSVAYDNSLEIAYVNAVCNDMLSYGGQNIKADTLYFGGGTPILISSDSVKKIIDTAKLVFDLNGEATIEANPNSTSRQKLMHLKEAGINRISFGVQSCVEDELKALGRLHSVEQAIVAVNEAYAVGIEDISVDIMLGTPYQTQESIQTTLETVTKLPINHISAYMLKVEQSTPYFGSDILSYCGDEDSMADIYLYTIGFLKQNGFTQYEISNFAKPLKESKHNLKYWRCEEYLGFGASAHSFMGNRRFYYPSDISSYINNVAHETITSDGNAGGVDEIVMLGLRLSEGIDMDKLKNCSNINYAFFTKTAQKFCDGGYATVSNNRLSITQKGYLVSNSIISELLTSID